MAAIVAAQSAPSILSGLAFIGRIGILLELLLGTATAATGIVGVLRCFGRNTRAFGAAHIDEECEPSAGQRRARGEGASEKDIEVTIRFEDGFLRSLHRHQLVATIRRPTGGVQDIAREVWFARDAKATPSR